MAKPIHSFAHHSAPLRGIEQIDFIVILNVALAKLKDRRLSGAARRQSFRASREERIRGDPSTTGLLPLLRMTKRVEQLPQRSTYSLLCHSVPKCNAGSRRGLPHSDRSGGIAEYFVSLRHPQLVPLAQTSLRSNFTRRKPNFTTK